jgi:hypothetical protein
MWNGYLACHLWHIPPNNRNEGMERMERKGFIDLHCIKNGGIIQNNEKKQTKEKMGND